MGDIEPHELPNTGGGGAAGPFDDDTYYCKSCEWPFDPEDSEDPNSELCDDCWHEKQSDEEE